MSVLIKSIKVFSELDSRGDPTIAGKLILSNDQEVISSIPNHLSQKASANFLETGKAVKYLNELLVPRLINIDPREYKKIDLWLDTIDKTPNKQVFGINSTLLISKLIYKAGAIVSNKPLYQYLSEIFNKNFQTVVISKLPTPIFNLISGASHGSLSLNFQEFGIIFSSNLNYSESVKQGSDLHKELEKVFHYRNIFAGVGHDGAYVPNLSSNFDALEIIKEALLKNGYKVGLDVFFALDIAASFFYKGGKYYVSEEVGTADTNHLLDLYDKIFKEYRFLILEDPFVDNDTSGWKQAMAKFGNKAYLLGDDLLMTDKIKLEKAAKDNLCSLADVKITLQPTIWKIFDFIATARKLSMKITISQTAIETNDDFISDLAVAVQSDYVKFGPPIRGERIVKHNRLLAIEKEVLTK